MKVAVLEFLCGGGSIDDVGASTLLSEGIAMLGALANDLVSCGHEVHTCLIPSSILSNPHLHPNVHVHPLDSKTGSLDWLEHWITLAKYCDRAIVIAPELDYQLSRIVARLRMTGAIVVAPSAEFLAATSDKLTTSRLLNQSSIPHPATQTLSEFRSTVRDDRDGVPITLKRRDGAGCTDMMIFADQGKLDRWLTSSSSRCLFGDDWLVQTWRDGRPASMALIAGQAWKVVGAVEQLIQFDLETEDGFSPVTYLGSAGPLQGVDQEQLDQLALKVHNAFPGGAAGWIGIDFLVPNDSTSPQELTVIEINPRLTSSYLSYRKWYGPMVSEGLLGADYDLGWNK